MALSHVQRLDIGAWEGLRAMGAGKGPLLGV